MKRIGYSITIMFLLAAATALAGAPGILSYQGYLADDDGTGLDTTIAMIFAIYDAETAGNMLWTETHSSVEVTTGSFSVILGATALIDDAVFAGEERWLAITVGGETIDPRTRLTSVPYASRVSTVEGAEGGEVLGDLSSTGRGVFGPGNSAAGTSAFVAGENNAAEGDHSSIGGGHDNLTGPTKGAPKSDGEMRGPCTSPGRWAVISGGAYNVACGDYSFIGGGANNMAEGLGSTVGGGNANHTGGEYSTVAGGIENEAIGDTATVGGGNDNSASGDYSTVPGGTENNADGKFSFAAGRRANASHEGTFVWGDGTATSFGSTGPNQFLIQTEGGVGINENNPQATLHLGGTPGVDGLMFPDGTLQTTAGDSGGGDITAVYADDGLAGGAMSNDAHLSVNTGPGLEISGDNVQLTTDHQDGSAHDSRFVNEGQANSITTGMIGSQQVANSDLAANAVTSDKIQNSSIQFADIAPNGATEGQVMKFTGGNWVPADDAGGGVGYFPAPAYNSGWIYLSGGAEASLVHNLGSTYGVDPLSFVVDLQFKSDDAGMGINNYAIGNDRWIHDGINTFRGGYYKEVLSNSITVKRASHATHADSIRVRIWIAQ